MATSVQQAKDFQNKMNTAVQGALKNIKAILAVLKSDYNKAIDTLAGQDATAKIPPNQMAAIDELEAAVDKIMADNFKQLGGSRRRFRKRASARGSCRKRRYSRG